METTNTVIVRNFLQKQEQEGMKKSSYTIDIDKK